MAATIRSKSAVLSSRLVIRASAAKRSPFTPPKPARLRRCLATTPDRDLTVVGSHQDEVWRLFESGNTAQAKSVACRSYVPWSQGGALLAHPTGPERGHRRDGTGKRYLFESYRNVAVGLGFGIEKRSGSYWVPNPAQEKENFADKWNSNPERKYYFDRWAKALVVDLDDAATAVGVDGVVRSLSRSHGTTPVEAAASRIAADVSTAAAAGGLGVTATGRVSPSISTKTPRHTFYGQQQQPRRRPG